LSVTGALSAKGGAVFNEDSADVDFRVESNDDANIFRIEAATNNVKIGSNAGNYGQLSIKNEKAGSQERGLYIELSPASGTSPNNIAVFAATNSNMTQPLVRIHHESPTADQLLLQATTTGSNTVKFSVDEDGDIYTAGGINLGGTGSANYLDDYEEGTFEATFEPSGSGSIGVGINSTLAYTKIGRQVTVIGLLGVGSVSSAVGDIYINGLPFTIGNLTELAGRTTASVVYLDESAGSQTVIAVRMFEDQTRLALKLNAASIAVNDDFYISATYFTS